MDIIVVGGGLMGTAAAFFLSRRGLRVTLLERRFVGQGATVASFGNIRRQGRYLPQLPLAHRSRALWGEIDSLLGEDVEFRATGHLRLIHDQDGMEDMQAFAKAAKPWGLDLEMLEPAEIRRRFPGLGPDAIGASFSPEDGSANPRLMAPAFARAAARAGARIVEQAEVTRIERRASGFAVETCQGIFESDQLLVTAGAWGAKMAAAFDEPVPLRLNGPQMAVTEPLPHRILPVVGVWARNHDAGVYFRQVERGNVVFGGGRRVEVPWETGFAKTDPQLLAVQLPHLVRLCPALAHVQVIRTWSGPEGYLSDSLPVMGPSGKVPGLHYAFGFCGHGFQLGPGVGDVMAELIATGQTNTPIGDFSVTRFQDQPAPEPVH
ncbi:FAD-dependent oxidoreductase [Pseudooceanicola sp. 216_PA32_1]|uniref:FAD-dependent oxidoreductase n=1 Tax=Pseudooceanicola pacificus TaxID=2676438 RepID=A0A844WER9_9RHOB|nr:FAD-binding oxidoreductase [Pseudooceanicola pacificus]MWB77639.1 FAD-dependent oxidoreductase [Pseudooceanicola pacificus]